MPSEPGTEPIRDGNQAVAEFVAGIGWDRLPPAVQAKARMALLDILGAALAGRRAPVSRITAGFAAATWPGAEATILYDGRLASAVGAAFANGYTANALDIDDCAIYTKGHPGAQIFPTALALAESLHLGGAEMLAAMVVGYEVAHRTARIWHATNDVYHACGSWGSVACAAVAAHLLGLPSEQVEHALGIAEYHAPNLPMMRDIDQPRMAKHGVGWGAMTGITAAQLAACGFTAIPSLLGQEQHRAWVIDIGQHYIMVDGVIWKAYAACAWGHAVFDAGIRLLRQHGITAHDIAHILVEGFTEVLRLGSDLPQTTEEAQFSIGWPLAVYLLDGEIGPEQMLEHRFGDERIRDLVGRIELVESKEFTRLANLLYVGDPEGRFLSAVTFVLKDGRTISSGPVEGGINYPQGWDEEQVERKFRWLTGRELGGSRLEEVLDKVWHFEQVPDVREFTRLVAAPGCAGDS